MLDASNIPSLIVGLIVGALAAYAWRQRQNRRGDR
jgi:predicted negative regulator of RcsB-dependent stress response